MTKIQLATKIWVMWCYNYDHPETFIGYICEKTGKNISKTICFQGGKSSMKNLAITL